MKALKDKQKDKVVGLVVLSAESEPEEKRSLIDLTIEAADRKVPLVFVRSKTGILSSRLVSSQLTCSALL